jgi:membrane protease YdiL (CAAX protease family)
MTGLTLKQAWYPLATFFILAYLISWLLWLPLALSASGLLSSPSAYLHLLGGAGPLLAALLVTRLTEGTSGFQVLVGRMAEWRVQATWLFVAVGGPVSLFFAAAVIGRIMAGTWPEWNRFGQSTEYPELGLAGYWIADIIFYGFGEEVGWRGYALPKLQRGRSALMATLILSVFWALWHVPLFWFAGGLQAMGIGEIAGWFFSIVTGSILLSWLYNSSRGSILAVALFHGVLDIVILSPVGGNLPFVMGALLTLWGVAVLVLTKPATLSANRHKETG